MFRAFAACFFRRISRETFGGEGWGEGANQRCPANVNRQIGKSDICSQTYEGQPKSVKGDIAAWKSCLHKINLLPAASVLSATVPIAANGLRSADFRSAAPGSGSQLSWNYRQSEPSPVRIGLAQTGNLR